MSSNLPQQSVERASDKEVRQFFDKYYTKSLNFPSNEVDAVIAFFTKRGFEENASIAIASEILTQAKVDNVKTFKILDTLKGLDEVQLSAVVAEIINYNRSSTSTLGYRRTETADRTERRNIVY